MSAIPYSSRKRAAKARTRGIPVDRLPLREVERLVDGKTRIALDLILGGAGKKEALVEAGMSPQSYSLLYKPLSQRYLELRKAQYRRKLNLNAERVLEEFAKIAFFNMGELLEIDGDGEVRFNLQRMTDDQAAALSELSIEEYVEGRGDKARKVKRVKLRPDSKRRALDSLARHLGLFNDRIEVTGGLAEQLQEGLIRAARSGDLKVPDSGDGSN